MPYWVCSVSNCAADSSIDLGLMIPIIYIVIFHSNSMPWPLDLVSVISAMTRSQCQEQFSSRCSLGGGAKVHVTPATAKLDGAAVSTGSCQGQGQLYHNHQSCTGCISGAAASPVRHIWDIFSLHPTEQLAGWQHSGV